MYQDSFRDRESARGSRGAQLRAPQLHATAVVYLNATQTARQHMFSSYAVLTWAAGHLLSPTLVIVRMTFYRNAPRYLRMGSPSNCSESHSLVDPNIFIRFTPSVFSEEILR
jgi:hypothetical protein